MVVTPGMFASCRVRLSGLMVTPPGDSEGALFKDLSDFGIATLARAAIASAQHVLPRVEKASKIPPWPHFGSSNTMELRYHTFLAGMRGCEDAGTLRRVPSIREALARTAQANGTTAAQMCNLGCLAIGQHEGVAQPPLKDLISHFDDNCLGWGYSSRTSRTDRYSGAPERKSLLI